MAPHTLSKLLIQSCDKQSQVVTIYRHLGVTNRCQFVKHIVPYRMALISILGACGFTCLLIAGPVGSIIYADLYGSIKINFPVLIRITDQ